VSFNKVSHSLELTFRSLFKMKYSYPGSDTDESQFVDKDDENVEYCNLNNENCRNIERRDITSPPQLHLADLIKEEEWNAVIELLTSNDAADKVKLRSSHHPMTHLHLACSTSKVPVRVIQAIITQYPDACLTEDEDGSLPIHVACSTPDMALEVIETLMITSPKSCLRRENNSGDLPIYLLIENNGSSNIEWFVSHLISSLPASCIYDKETSVINDVCNNILPEAIIHQILEIHPQVCCIPPHNNGDTLLHILCSHNEATPRTIRIIVNLHPGLCAEQDNEGNLPLHVVNSRNQPEEIIRILLNAYPHGIFIRNALGQMPLSAHAIRDSPTKIKAILSYSDFSAVRHLLCIKDKCGLVPAQDFYYKMQCDLTCSMISSHNDLLPYLNLECHPTLINQIKSLYYLTTAYVYGSIDKIKSEGNLMVPHQSFFWTAFPLFTKMILQVFPQLAKERDCNGTLPLHIIAKEVLECGTCRCFTCGVFPIVGPFLQYNGGRKTCIKCSRNTNLYHTSGSRPIGMPLVEYKSHEVIKDIIYAYPEAASIPDPFGDLPLHLSLRAGKTWDTGVKEIFEAAPHAIHVQDRKLKQFPFMIAASKRLNDSYYPVKVLDTKQEEIESSHQIAVDLLELTTVFELLRRYPCAVDSN